MSVTKQSLNGWSLIYDNNVIHLKDIIFSVRIFEVTKFTNVYPYLYKALSL